MAAKSKNKAVKKKSAGPRRRAAKPTKDEQVEVSGPDIGVPPLLAGNLPPIKDLIYYNDTLAGLQDRARTASGKVSDWKKKMREDGVDVKSVTDFLGLERLDPLELATYLRQLQALASAKGLPVQMQLFEPKHGSVEDQAKAEGWRDAKADRSPNTQRWPEGTPGHVEYSRAWNDGTRDNTVKRVTGGEESEPEDE